jgi:hypothetical protein
LCYNSSDNGKYVALALRDMTIVIWESIADKIRIIDFPIQLKGKSESRVNRETMESKFCIICNQFSLGVKQIYISDDSYHVIIITTTNTPWLYDSTEESGEWIMLPSHVLENDTISNDRMSFTVVFGVNPVRRSTIIINS